MTIRRLEKTQLKDYFDRISRQMSACEASIEIGGNDIGNQIESEPAILHGLAYDPNDDEFEVITETLDHLIVHPQEVYVDDDIEGLHSVQVIDEAGHKQIISLHQPLQLPPG